MTVVVGERREDRLAPVVDELQRGGAEALLAGQDFDLLPAGDSLVFRGLGRTIGGLKLGLHGAHQRSNAAVAVASAITFARRAGLGPLTSEAVQQGLASAFLPGRQEETQLDGGARVLLDGAHNGAGARALAASLRGRVPSRRVWLVASMRDKDRDPMYDALLPHVDEVWCCKGLSSPRFEEPAVLVEEVRRRAVLAVDVGTPGQGIARAEETLQEGDELLVAGSLYLVGDVRPLLGLALA